MTANVTRLVDLIRAVARRQRGAPAVECDGATRTFGELLETAEQLARGLLASGLSVGDRVGILSTNRPEYLEAYLACQLAGLVAVPINFRLVADDVAYVLGNSGARGVIVAEDLLPVVQKAIAALPHAAQVVVVVIGKDGQHPLTYAGLAARNVAGVALPSVAPLDPAVIFYTSGTTGFPKGATMSHLNVLGRLVSWGWDFGISAEDVVLVPGPVFHMSYSSLALVTLAAGGRVVLMKDFDGPSALDVVERHAVTWSFLVPKMISMVLAALGERGQRVSLSSVRGLLSSGSLLPRPLLEGLTAALPGVRISDAYGWTETGWVSMSRHKDLMTREPSVGRAAFGCELAVLDDDGRELPPGELGEIHAANPMTFLGYWGNPGATAAMRRGKWESGGDIGFLDGNGFLHLVDRKNDMIISGGENVFPAEIERVLAQHPKILELAVVGVPDERWGESPRACVVLQPGVQAAAEEIIRFCDGRLARYKLPRSVTFIDALPRNAMGKVLRRELRERFWKGHQVKIN